MCLSIPSKVLSIDGNMAEVSVGGNIFKAGIQLLDDVKVGDYVLLHAGFAIQKIREAEAEEMLRVIEGANSLDHDYKD